MRRLATDPRVMRYISTSAVWDDARIRRFVERQRRQLVDLGYCLWKLVLKDGGEMIGFCGLQPLPGTDETEIGWWLVPEQWDRGLASEAARAIVALSMGPARIVAIAQPPNRASIRIMEKLGM